MKFLSEGVEGTEFKEFRRKLFLNSYEVGTAYWSTFEPLGMEGSRMKGHSCFGVQAGNVCGDRDTW